MLDFDDYSGVGSMSLLDATTDTSFVLIARGRYAGVAGIVLLVSNSTTTDQDGDGVGLLLEQTLNSCDSATTFPRCAQSYNLQDSDRDGIGDYHEIFGVDGVSPLRLHRYGAWPSIKDIFVEIDWSHLFASSPLGATSLSDDHIREFAHDVRDLFVADNISAMIGNINGFNGIRIHMDIGRNPTLPDDSWLYGDWGGSSRCTATADAIYAYDNCLTPNRRGFFRVALASTANGGAADVASSGLWWGVSAGTTVELRPREFVHELGHVIGLEHWGSDFYGGERENCSPLYRSIMNYCYGESEQTGFSLGDYTGISLNPASTFETPGYSLPWQFNGAPWRFEIDNPKIDWNRDGLFTSNAVRSSVTFNAKADQALANEDRTISVDGLAQAVTPAIALGYGNRHYIFYVKDGQIHYRAGLHSGTTNGGCPGDDLQGRNDPNCTEFTSATGSVSNALSAGQSPTNVSATWWQGHVRLAYTVDSGELYTVSSTGSNSTGQISGWTGRIQLAEQALGRPSMAVWNVSASVFGVNQLLGVVFGNAEWGTYDYTTRTASSASWSEPLPIISQGNTVLALGTGAAVVPWPSTSPPIGFAGTTCAALSVGDYTWSPGDSSSVRLYCLNSADPLRRWTQVPFGTSEIQTVTPPALAYHIFRYDIGTPYANQRGAFWISRQASPTSHPLVLVVAPGPNNPGMSSLSGDWELATSGPWGNVWSRVSGLTGIELHSDPSVGAMKGAWVASVGEPSGLRFEPLADGTFDGQLCDGNDWLVMNRTLCVGLRRFAWNDANSYCGTEASHEVIQFGSRTRGHCSNN